MSPDFLPPARCDFSHARKGKWPLSRVFLLKRPFSLSRVGKNRISQGVENRGSLISVPLALRVCQGPLNGGVSNGGFPDLDLSFLFCPFLSFLGLSRFFWDFPDLLGDSPGIFPICPFPLSRPIKSTYYEEQSRKVPRHNLDLSRKKWETPGFGNPPVSQSIF